MSVTFTGSDKIGEVVARFPGASNIFKEYSIDFCCGGNRSLSLALKQQNINEEEVLAKLNQAYDKVVDMFSSSRDWREASSAELIDHIVNTHHAYLNQELPLLSEFVTKILRVHGPAHEELAQLHRLFHNLKLELDQHLIKEETILFPLIREYEQNPSEEVRAKAAAQLDEIESEHTGAGDILREMRAITNDYQLPEGACRTYTLTFQKLVELESDLFQHIHLENNILFLRVAAPACGC